MNKLVSFIKLTRTFEWLHIIQTTLIFVLIYFFFTKTSFLEPFLFYLIYHIVVLTYGFIINSIADKKTDLIAGKKTVLEEFPVWFTSLLVLILGIFILLFPLSIGFNSTIIGIFIFLTATFYSVKPVRLKERGFLGLIATTLATTAFPLLFLLSIVNQNIQFGIFLVIALFFKELFIELNHQISDFYNDKKSNTKTWATKIGLEKTKTISKLIVIIFVIWVFLSPYFGIQIGLIIIPLLLIFNAQAIANTLYEK